MKRSLAILSLVAGCGATPPAELAHHDDALGGAACTTSAPVLAALASGVNLDADGDGLVDDVETQLANCFAPEYHFDSAEPALAPDEPFLLFSARPDGFTDSGHLKVALHYVELWRKDGGYIHCSGVQPNWCDDHVGDDQEIDLEVEVTGPKSATLLTPFADDTLKVFPTFNGTHQLIFPSAGKHHEYAGKLVCPGGGDFDSCLKSSGFGYGHYDRANGAGPAVTPTVAANLGQLENVDFAAHPDTTPKGFVNRLSTIGLPFPNQFIYDANPFMGCGECSSLFAAAALTVANPPVLPGAPTVVSAGPESPPAGNTKVEIHGTGFNPAGGTDVSFGGVPALSVSCPSSSQCFAVTPPGAGRADVRVTVSYRTSAPSEYWYTPSVTSVSPATGTIGDKVTIYGHGFDAFTTVQFGDAGAFSSCSATSCTATVPSGAGVVDVRVVSGKTMSGVVAADHFTYAKPVIKSVDPASGPITGGSPVGIYGSGFVPGSTEVWFGSVKSPSVSCSDWSACIATSPVMAAPGKVDVAVKVQGIASAPSPAAQFTYTAQAKIVNIAFQMFVLPTLVLDGAAPAGGAQVTLTTDDPDVLALPATLFVPAGSNGVQFALEMLSSKSVTESVTLTASYAGSTFKKVLSVSPTPPVSLEFDQDARVEWEATDAEPVVLAQGESTTVTVRLLAPAPAGGAHVALASSMPSAVAVPASVFVPAGGHLATFPVTNQYNGSPVEVTLTATFQGHSGSESLWVPASGEKTCKPRKCPPRAIWDPAQCACVFGDT